MLRPFWRYYGGKWRAAPRYPAPQCASIVEPFAGAAGYSLRYPDRKVILVEKYDVIVAVWRFLIGASRADVLSIPLVDSVDDLPDNVRDGARALVGFCMNSGAATPRRSMSAGQRFVRDRGRRLESWGAGRRDLVASQVDAIRHWTIVDGDYRAAPDVEAAWFVDPPYCQAGIHYRHSSRDIDYQTLGEWCRSRRGQVIVCEASGAEWLPFTPLAGGVWCALARTCTARKSRGFVIATRSTPDDRLIAADVEIVPCSIDHAALKMSDRWNDLAFAGRQYTPADKFGPELTLELRNCSCGSTLARIVETTDADRATPSRPDAAGAGDAC